MCLVILYGFGYVLEDQDVGGAQVFKQRLIDNWRQGWHENITKVEVFFIFSNI